MWQANTDMWLANTACTGKHSIYRQHNVYRQKQHIQANTACACKHSMYRHHRVSGTTRAGLIMHHHTMLEVEACCNIVYLAGLSCHSWVSLGIKTGGVKHTCTCSMAFGWDIRLPVSIITFPDMP